MDRNAFEIRVCTIRPHFNEDWSRKIDQGVRFHPLGLRGGASAALIKVHNAPQPGRMLRTGRRMERWMAQRLGLMPLAQFIAVRRATAEAWQLDPDSVALVPLGVGVKRFVGAGNLMGEMLEARDERTLGKLRRRARLRP